MFISGAMLGTMVGSFTLLVLMFAPFTMDDLRDWQNESQVKRDQYVS